MVAFKITETDHSAFLSQLEAVGCKLVLVSELSAEQVDALKIKYYQYGIINRVDNVPEDKINELKKDVDSLYYRSSKLVASKGLLHLSKAAVRSSVPLHSLDEYQKVIDTPEFWNELDFCTIIKKK